LTLREQRCRVARGLLFYSPVGAQNRSGALSVTTRRSHAAGPRTARTPRPAETRTGRQV